MYRKHLSQKASPSIRSTPINKEISPSPSYGSLSSVVQRVQQDPNSVSEDERQQLESAIGTRSTKEILAGKQTQWLPEFQGISAQIWGNSGQAVAPIQAKLTIGEVGDQYEQEADRVAKDVVQRIHTPQTNPPTTLQRQEIEDEELQRKELPQIVQRREGIAGGEASTDLDTAINSARGGGQPLDVGLQNSMGQAMGADFSGVRVHTDAQADKLNRSIQAKAFTTGQDVFFRQGAYQPGSRGGQELIAHELTHVVQQNGLQSQKLQQKQLTISTASTSLSRDVIQRVFQPATTTSKLHLRAQNAGNVVTDQKIGREIPSGAELVIDNDNKQVQKRKILKDVTWTRAVDVTGSAWDPTNSPTDGGFIRASSVRLMPPIYPKPDTLAIGSRGNLDVEKAWHENIGEYIPVEDSIENPGEQIVKVGTEFKRMDRTYTLHALTLLEKTQVNDVSRDNAAQERLTLILTDAANNGGINPNLLATPENVEELKHPLRLTVATYDQKAKNKWNIWAQAVYGKIASGAADLVASLNHWTTQLSPLNPALCQITRIKLEGSDLHDKGLGAVFVDFTKPIGGLFPTQTNLTVVIKPEDRNIEKSLFGTQNTSLAHQVNTIAVLHANDAITQIEMETHANYGSIIEFVQGQQARAIKNTGLDTQAMSEGIAFAFLAGLSDVHQDNVIWHNGKPYFIDADNALNASRLKEPSSQSGFSQNNQTRTNTDIEHLKNDPGSSRSAIVQSLLANSTPLLDAVKNAYTGKTGRIVPLYTNFWANQLKLNGYITAEDGKNTDGMGTDETFSRWYIANKAAAKLPRGDKFGAGNGLVGESGIASTGEWFDRNTEAAQIKADLDQGKVPFYTYDYTLGHIFHNGQVIWHGQTLADAMAILLLKFPAP